MCGIAGLYALNGFLTEQMAGVIQPMTDRLAHRGPDGSGYFCDLRAALGHRRLAIIDREGGAQPMRSRSGLTVVFNGEIYNHKTLRQELAARGHAFQTHSDTEVILHAYAQHGVGCVERLHGMFAFAIYDSIKGELFLARDRLGKKPLFYAALGGVLHFASELKSIRESPAWDGTIDSGALEEYLSLGYILAPRTIYRHVRKLAPGEWLLARRSGFETRTYWDIHEFDSHPDAGASVVSEVESVLRESVTARLESEVPLGAFLSGGVDSGLVVSYMAEATALRVQTTSVGFGDRGHNELEAAACTARHWHTQHTSEVVEPRLDEVLDRVVDAFDEPFADPSAIPTYYVSQAARRHVTVALSGDGGDEAFGGYSFRYVPHALESAVRRAGGSPAQWAARQVGRHWPRAARLPRALRLGTVLDNVGVDAPTAYFMDLCGTKPQVARRLLGMARPDDIQESSVFAAVTSPYRRCSSPSAVQRAQYADLKIYLANDVLVKVDRMSMVHSLEVRCPLLDHRLVELAFRIPRATKMPWLQPKHLLRQIARRRLPIEITQLPKHGFSAPAGAWLAGPYRTEFMDDVLSTSSFASSVVDRRMVRAMLDAHCRRERDHSAPLWAIWMMERWHRIAARDGIRRRAPHANAPVTMRIGA